MKRSALWIMLFLAALLASCAPRSITVPAVAVPPLAPTPAEVVVTMQPEPGLGPTPTPPAAAPVLPTDPTPTAPAVSEDAASRWVAYLADDGNIWLVNPGSGEMRQVTLDGTPMNNAGGGETVFYGQPKWSSDGQMLATERQHGVPVEWGMQYEFNLLVYDLAAQTSRVLLDGQQTAGFEWQPGTRQIAFGQTVAQEYFSTRGGVDSSWARAIASVNVDTGEITDLVKPERGYSLVNPVFSPDGKKVGFDEVFMMEGKGKFAYYDFEAQKYIAWDKAIGAYRWLPDGQGLLYDYMTYMPSGQESIYRNNLAGDAEQHLLPESASGGFAYGPALSADGSQVAYINGVFVDGVDAADIRKAQVMVISIGGGKPRALGEFEEPADLRWSADGQQILLGAGPWFQGRQVGLLPAAGGAFRPLAGGTYAEWQP